MRARALLFGIVLTSAISLAQAPDYPAPILQTSQLLLTLNSPPQGPALGSASVIGGQPGTATYFYWVVSNFTIGNSSPAGPFVARQAPNTLSGSTYVQVSWSPVFGAGTYDLLRTSTPAAPTGACGCAVATGISSTSQADQSNTLNAYTVSAVDPNSLNLTITNEATGAGTSHAILRQNGLQIADLSVAAVAPPVVWTQNANGADVLTLKRFTDTAPAGNFLNFKNAAGTASLFSVDVNGNISSGPGEPAASTVGTGSSVAGTAIRKNPTGCAGNPCWLPAVAGDVAALSLKVLASAVTNIGQCQADTVTYPKCVYYYTAGTTTAVYDGAATDSHCVNLSTVNPPKLIDATSTICPASKFAFGVVTDAGVNLNLLTGWVPNTGGVTFPSVVYATALTGNNAAIGTTTMVTPVSDALYRFSYTLVQTTTPASCTAGAVVTPRLGYTEAKSSVAIAAFATAAGGNSATGYSSGVTMGNNIAPSNNFTFVGKPLIIWAKAGAAVTIDTTFTANSCTGLTYVLTPVLEQLQ